MTETVERRSFLRLAAAALPFAALPRPRTPQGGSMAHFTPAGADRLGHPHEMGITSMRYKVVASDTNGGLLILEQTNREKGGPARHLHHDQDEWFYAFAGQFIVEVGTERFTLGPGDSLLAPRKVPHVWAFSGNGEGRLLVGFTPAGQMEGFFAEATKNGGMPPRDPALWQKYGMELVGPPLSM